MVLHPFLNYLDASSPIIVNPNHTVFSLDWLMLTACGREENHKTDQAGSKYLSERQVLQPLQEVTRKDMKQKRAQLK